MTKADNGKNLYFERDIELSLRQERNVMHDAIAFLKEFPRWVKSPSFQPDIILGLTEEFYPFSTSPAPRGYTPKLYGICHPFFVIFQK